MAQLDIKNCIFKFKSKTKELEIKIGEGNLTYSEKRNIEYVLNRGLIDEVRNGDQEPMDVSVDAVWESLKSTGTIESIRDWLAAIDAAESVDPDECRPPAVDIEVTIANICASGTETWTWADFRYESIDGDMRAGTFSISGRCNSTEPDVVRT